MIKKPRFKMIIRIFAVMLLTLELGVTAALTITGWPQSTGAVIYASPAIADLDPAYPGREVVIGSLDRNLYVFHADGTLFWKQPVDGWIYSSPAIADLDPAYPGLEVVVSSLNFDYPPVYNDLYVFHADGTPVSGWPIKVSDNIYSSPAVADLDGDGNLEIIVAGNAHYNVYVFKVDGTLLPGWPQQTTQVIYASPTVADLDEDGDLEVLIGSYDNKVYAWHADGTPVSGWPQTTGGKVYATPAVADLDPAYPGLEVVEGSNDHKVYAWHADGTPVSGWPQTTDGIVNSSPAITDLDNDKVLEVIVGAGSGKVYAWHADGTPVSGWPQIAGSISDSSPAIADLDPTYPGLEVVLGSKDWKVYAWHADGTLVTGWPQTTGGEIYSSPAIADLDGDRILEVVVGSKDHNVYVWSSTQVSCDPMPWPMFHHDEMHTGFYKPLYACGDANNDGTVTVSDVVYLVNYLFKGGPGVVDPIQGDPNSDGKITVSDVVFLVNFLFKGGTYPCMTGKLLALPGGNASIGLGSANSLSDGTKQVYYNGSLTTPAAGFSIDLITYDPAQVKLKAVYPTTKTSGFTIYLNDDLKGNIKIGVFKPDGSTVINSGTGALLDLRFVANNLSSIRLVNSSFSDRNGLDMGISIYQAIVPRSITPYTPAKSSSATLY